ncbi:phage baseplate assembly protein gpV [Bradyrhizobium sp. USDA 4354]
MGKGFLEWVAGVDEAHGKHARLGAGYSISPGTVVDNLNLLAEGRVQVHIPSLPAFDPWARIAAVGAGSGRGFAWVPQIDDEVLVAFNQNDERDAYILGGLWSMSKRPPITDPISFLNKRVIKTGMKASPLAQTIELDDLTQSVTITTSIGHSITLGLKSIELSAPKGVMKISMDLGPPPSITIQAAPAGNIDLIAPTGTITLQANQVEITGTTATNIKSAGMVSIRGPQVQLN